MIKTSVETLALNALDNVIRQLWVDIANLRGDDFSTLSSVYTNDLADISTIRNYLLRLDNNFHRIIQMVMDLDTAPRDAILEEFDRQGLRDAVEETGLVTYADPPSKRTPWREKAAVKNAITTV